MVREKRPARGAEHCTRRERLSAQSGAGSVGCRLSVGGRLTVGGRLSVRCRLSVGSQLSVGFRQTQSTAGRGSEIDVLDFFGVDGALEKAGADADEALDGIGSEDRARGMRVRTTTANRSADDVPGFAACKGFAACRGLAARECWSGARGCLRSVN
jgi:hypothetical protein